MKTNQYNGADPGGSAGARLSIVMPVLDEAAVLPRTLRRLQGLRAAGHELICVDGGSTDGSLERCLGLADHLLRAPRGRASQMNAGAEAARGDVLLFLHADTVLPQHGAHRVLAALTRPATSPVTRRARWGFFAVRLDGRGAAFRVIERAMSLRSRLTGIGTGDQCLFVERALFQQVGGFPPIALMEDVALCRILRRAAGAPAWIDTPVTSSARYWERHGIWRSVLRMWSLRAAYALGTDPARLHARYYKDPGR